MYCVYFKNTCCQWLLVAVTNKQSWTPLSITTKDRKMGLSIHYKILLGFLMVLAGSLNTLTSKYLRYNITPIPEKTWGPINLQKYVVLFIFETLLKLVISISTTTLSICIKYMREIEYSTVLTDENIYPWSRYCISVSTVSYHTRYFITNFFNSKLHINYYIK